MKNVHYLAISLTILFILPTVTLAFGEEKAGQYLNRRAEIWNLFFRMTTAAFVIGSVVSATLVWVIWRFRESNPKNKTPTKWETGESH